MAEPPAAVNPPAAPPHLLVVDDDRRLRALLHDFLCSEGEFVVSTAADAAQAEELLQFFRVDLVVLDVMMPGETGTAFLQRRRSVGDATPVLMLTARGESSDRISGLEAGADDYLPKPFEPRELLLRINAILRRQPKVTPAAAVRLGRWRFDPARDELVSPSEIVRLSSVEAGLLRALTAQAGTIVSREALIARQPLSSNERTIDVQVTRLRRKIEADPKQPRYLITVRGEGYVLRPDP